MWVACVKVRQHARHVRDIPESTQELVAARAGESQRSRQSRRGRLARRRCEIVTDVTHPSPRTPYGRLMSTDSRRARGALGERLAERHLAAAGYALVERNFRTRYGELDLVAADAQVLVFCEVKTRVEGSLRGPASPLEAIGPDKRRRLRLMAAQWLASRAGDERPAPALLRFDAIGVTLTRAGGLARLEHVEEAF